MTSPPPTKQGGLLLLLTVFREFFTWIAPDDTYTLMVPIRVAKKSQCCWSKN